MAMAAANALTVACTPSVASTLTTSSSCHRYAATSCQAFSSVASTFRASEPVFGHSSSSTRARCGQTTIRAHTETEVEVSRAACPPVKPPIDASAFAALDLRVGVITDAKPVEDAEMSAKRGKPTLSRTHLQLTVDIGCEVRTLVSECKFVMDVEDAVGKKVLIAANVAPSDVLGIRSHGLILTGYNYDPTPMPRSFKVILPGGLGRLPPGSRVLEVGIPE